MQISLINPYVVKILIALRPEDSINAVAKRINLSYGWTYRWVRELMGAGAVKELNKKIVPQENNRFYKDTIAYVKRTFAGDVGFYYSVLGLFGITYCFTKTDAVFVWTKGGYNIGRSKEHYPFFIKVKQDDRILFEYYCKKLGLRINERKGVFYSVEFVEDIKLELCAGVPVEPLDTTIEFMKKYIYNFQPALEMVGEMYGKKMGVKYKEVSMYA